VRNGVVVGSGKTKTQLGEQLLAALAQHRFWERENADSVPA